MASISPVNIPCRGRRRRTRAHSLVVDSVPAHEAEKSDEAKVRAHSLVAGSIPALTRIHPGKPRPRSLRPPRDSPILRPPRPSPKELTLTSGMDEQTNSVREFTGQPERVFAESSAAKVRMRRRRFDLASASESAASPTGFRRVVLGFIAWYALALALLLLFAFVAAVIYPRGASRPSPDSPAISALPQGPDRHQ